MIRNIAKREKRSRGAAFAVQTAKNRNNIPNSTATQTATRRLPLAFPSQPLRPGKGVEQLQLLRHLRYGKTKRVSNQTAAARNKLPPPSASSLIGLLPWALFHCPSTASPPFPAKPIQNDGGRRTRSSRACLPHPTVACSK